jgi:hypothetical protein
MSGAVKEKVLKKIYVSVILCLESVSWKKQINHRVLNSIIVDLSDVLHSRMDV